MYAQHSSENVNYLTRLAKKKPHSNGRYWLEQRPTSPYWYRVSYDPAKKQYTKASLRTTDPVEAQRLLDAYVSKNLDPDRRSPDNIWLHQVMNYYFEQHAKNIRSSKMQKTAIGFWREYFGQGTAVSDVVPTAVQGFVAVLRARGHSDGYISRILGVGRAALNFARDNLVVSHVPKIKDCQTRQSRESAEPMGRPLAFAETVRLLRANPQEHIKTFLFILINTMCRPEAALQLTKQQVDFEEGLIHLNPKGRIQTKKHRPVVPLTPSLRDVLLAVEKREVEAASERGDWSFKFTRYVTFRGRPVRNPYNAWRSMVQAAGMAIDPREQNSTESTVTPYSIRHTMGRELRKCGVSGEEISMFLGHRPKGAAQTTAIYAPYAPDYLRNAARVLDSYTKRLHAELDLIAAIYKGDNASEEWPCGKG